MQNKATATEGGIDLNPVLKIKNGLIRGVYDKTRYDDFYYRFEGIPYAQPPVGDLRFKSPRPATDWQGIRDCTDMDVKPLQKSIEGEIEGTEDCLYLNVYTKTLDVSANLPVMVYIYGGGFVIGDCGRSKYGPEYLLKEDVIHVIFNYRLTIFGFLSFADPSLEIPGNAGLKDQALALRWVRDNITHFGGNKDNITLFGESAGAASVHYMMCTENTKGLFHKAICMSGCILNNWALKDNNTYIPYRLACEQGYMGGKDDRSVLEYLQNCSVEQLLSTDTFDEGTRSTGGYYTFIPSIEPYDSENAVIRKPLLELLKTSWANEIPLVIGGTSFEGLIRYPLIKNNASSIKEVTEDPEKLLPPEVLKNKSQEQKNTMLQNICKLHFRQSGGGPKEEIMDYLDYHSMRGFWHSLHRFVKARQRYAVAPTYQYLFDFDSPTFNHHRIKFCGSDIDKGVAHADDLSYLLSSSDAITLDRDSEEYTTLRRMVRMWTQFAKTSNPNCEYTKDSAWRSISETSYMHWLRISNELSFEEMDKKSEKEFKVWNSLYGDELI